MIDLQALIRASKEALEELQNGTYEIITRTTPATWEDLRSDLETKLVPILKKLYDQIGGLMQQPTVILPDGVTSTSLVSQSEMTQFVTNTLNAWLSDLEDRIRKAREQSIFMLQPITTLTKYNPIKISLSTPSINLTTPTITLAKARTYKLYVTVPPLTLETPLLTLTKER